MSRKYFGTDGVRGRVGQHPITAEFMLKLGWAVGRVLSRKGKGKVLIGKDTRISGYMFESALEAGLSAAGVDVHLTGPMPTPGIAYLTRTLHADAGIVISASHNPYYDNGVKFFSAAGTKLPDEVEKAIEEELDKPMETVDSAILGKAARIKDSGGRYIEFCKGTIPISITLKGLKLVVDCAHGATYHVSPAVFEELGASVHVIGDEPDGLNINQGVGSTEPQLLQEEVLKRGADAGIALDGDGDRVIMVDHKGEIVDGDELLYVIAQDRYRQGTLGNAVVGTLMSNLGLEHALRSLEIDFHRARVGDRYVMEMLKSTGAVLGGEGSGHIICLDRTSTGDGTVSALQVLAAMVGTGRSLHELKTSMKKYPQVLVNVSLTQALDVENDHRITSAVLQAEQELGDQGRVLLRCSGTEPLVRVMVEGTDSSQVVRVAEGIADVVRSSMVAAEGGSVANLN